ncbi:GNAT family N-acetyltransferase [Massilia sp. BJB1822]|uniref:GNAT family N-acetyltransferase n=1 Tax=Massilia sp. BJB1822 TaxID=2744470 RepID=UPI0015940228|nr:GNAT family N-acetyltransferase [Massilia sp. BJB1822]NVD97819.1 GNAT family N-acetyltransferase [Massilia sp. BJB1822]
MAVRPYIETDFQAVCRIYLDAKRDELAFERGDFLITPLDQDAVIRAAFKESAVLVFESDEVLGFSATFDGQLRALFVHSSARGRGAGGALLNAVLAEAPQGISLNVAKSNEGARRFYEEHGFAAVGEIVRQYGGYDVAYLQMRRESM